MFRKIMICICLLGIITSSCYLGKAGHDYYKARKSSQDIVEKAVVDITEAEDENLVNYHEGYLYLDFESLKEENPDIIAWIDIPQTKISYPVLFGEDNEQYLHKDYHNEDSVSGSIFVDARFRNPFQSQNTVIYGHNMKDGSMFRSLQDYVKKDLYDKAPYIHIYLTDGSIQIYKIISAHVISDEGYAYSDEVSDDFIQELDEHNKIEFPDEAKKDDQFLTLSTCTNNGSEFPYRTVVQGRLEEIIP